MTNFKRARTEEQIASRQREILAACDEIYTESGFDGVTLKAIATRTSISRPSIYNYYATKEEILLDILGQEYGKWCDELKESFDQENTLTREKFCQMLTNSLLRHEKMLKLMTINLNSIESKCGQEKLTQFKKDIFLYAGNLKNGLKKVFPSSTDPQQVLFMDAFFSYICGLYIYTHPSEKQLLAMQAAGFPEINSFEDLCYKGLEKLLLMLS